MSIRILEGDCREVLKMLPAESVHCVVTSPPYWGLRNYGVEGAIGLEPTLQEHIDALVAVFREVRRVLRKDGTCWLNYGDCYATGAGRVGEHPGGGEQGEKWRGVGPVTQPNRMPQRGLKPKDLVLMHARIALALQADGWWLRSEIIWHKPNPMPASVRDRPTSAHEKMFLFTKSARYFYDADAVREPHHDPNRGHGEHENKSPHTGRLDGPASGQKPAAFTVAKHEYHPLGRNLRNVWTIPTYGYKEAHFATFPPKLIEPCIKAGTSEKGCCAECGAPWERVVDKTYISPLIQGEHKHKPTADTWKGSKSRPRQRALDGTFLPRTDDDRRPNHGSIFGTRGSVKRMGDGVIVTNRGWQATCDHESNPTPCMVLDPFGGSGTVGLVANRLGRDAILIELNPDYAAMAQKRIQDDAPLLTEVS